MLRSLIPDHLRCDELFLLIGTNTLPNWVAAKLLVKSEGRAHLVYTSGVRKHAERLKAILEEERIRVEWFETAEADERKIFSDVRRHAETLKKNDRKIGLNYTGGTKMMSVHAHRAMRDLCLTDSLSYLDARSLQMKFDYPNGGEFDISLEEQIRIEIKKLFRLHDDYPDLKINPNNQKARGVPATAGLIGIHSKYSGQQIWREWCDKLKVGRLNLRKLKEEQPDKYDDEVLRLNEKRFFVEEDFGKQVKKHLEHPDRKFSPPDVQRYLQKIVASYRSLLAGLKVNGDDSLQTAAANTSGEFANALDLAKWLDGMWLEDYAFDQLQSVAGKGDCDINQNGLAINLKPENREGREFEADVIAVRGYQLFYLSCSTASEKSKLKPKLFEALERATQLGGDEAKIGLVCNSDSPVKLRQECEADWESFASNQIEVFGREDLPILADELKRWFKGERRKGR